jgi:3-hydroxyisobutyrate dehydrogenase-like beta-hydroxyacid dehydrogenase
MIGGGRVHIGILGLGSMGAPIARRLVAAGHSVRGYNRTRSRADALRGERFEVADTAAAAAQADILISMVSDDTALEDVLFADTALTTGDRPGLVHVCMSTISDCMAERLEAAHRQVGQVYVSAPVFGPPEAARDGKLFIAVAGPVATVEAVRPVLALLGRIDVIGTRPASANVVKFAGNFLLASAVEGLRESIGLVTAAGADPAQFVGIVTQALFPTPVYQYIGGSIANRARDGGLTIANPFARSAQLAAAAAERLGVRAPVAREIAAGAAATAR